ncbi:MAG: hypothetical protein IJJ15_01510 [Ruminococcus sp.]|nr:hypothetical protein [Ruminococcus sp.]
MRKSKGLYIFALILIALQISVILFFLYGCTRIISVASDELVMFSWRSASDRGAEVSLSFDEDNAVFSYTYNDVNCTVEGIYVASCDSFTICDDNSGTNYTFEYILHGDRLELSYNNSLIILEKA